MKPIVEDSSKGASVTKVSCEDSHILGTLIFLKTSLTISNDKTKSWFIP
ncbi:hypothetical protein MtrunA17_Chr5g0420531 [Medicago truncatula]|uniref:Uncharacterized protein n=1 Tax=Medicago truncatula TaxID=3880 RepID=A0A396HY84_MEDTR|nr:hypothetical protein MtrunA17_Chr5g0420531 [Medicago truncatula]